MPVQALAQPAAKTNVAITYDDCMRRVMRVSDVDLRIEAMKSCEAAK